MKARLNGATWRLGVATGLIVVIAALLVGCGGTSFTNTSSSGATAASTGVLTVAYGSDWVFMSPEQGTTWWNDVQQQFQAKYPGWTVKYVKLPGSYNDLVTKLNLLDRSPGTAPDVAQRPTDSMGSYVASGVLLPMDKYVANADWWSQFPENVKNQTIFDGTVYGVNQGESTSGIYYNKKFFKQAGIPVPWQPKTWNDVLAAGEKIKQALPNVWPIWLIGGLASGPINVQYNGGNLLLGSTNPTVYDSSTKKWVVDSPGLRETFNFYRELGLKGYQAPLSVLLSPTGVINLPNYIAQQKVAIAFSGSWFGESWVKATSAPYWPQASVIEGVAKVPTENGQAPGYATALGGWELCIGSHAKNADMAWNFINICQQQTNMINAANHAGFLPPVKSYWTDPAFVNYAPPFNGFFAQLIPAGVVLGNSLNDYDVWANGFNSATGAIMQKPQTTVDQAVGIMKQYVTNQLGADKVETLQ